jgi:hypothetical protein
VSASVIVALRQQRSAVGYGAGFIRCDREGDHMDASEMNTVDRRAALRRIGGLTAAGVVGATAATLLPGGLVRAQVGAPPGMVFHPINPYRAVDTRRQGEAGRLVSGFTVQHALWTDENGVAKIPETSGAVTYNLTATQTVGNGFLAIFPGNTTWGGISSINWTVSNADIANGGTVGLGPAQLTGPGSVHVHAGGFASTFFVIDVTGYYHTA